MGKAMIIMVLGFSTIFGTMLFNMSTTQQVASQKMQRAFENRIRWNASESLTNVAVSRFYRGETPNDTLSFFGVQAIARTVNATFDTMLQHRRQDLIIETRYRDKVDSTRTSVLISPAFSYYQYLPNFWPVGLNLGAADTLDGPVHSNTAISLSGSAGFMGRISSTAPFGIVGAPPLARGGLEFGSPGITIPQAAATASLRLFGGLQVGAGAGAIVTFNSDTTVKVLAAPNPPVVFNLTAVPDHIIWSNLGEDITVRGTVPGQITVVSGKNIVIDSSLVCKTHPLNPTGSDDFIGLIAESDVIFRYTATADPDLFVHASVIASRALYPFPGGGALRADNPGPSVNLTLELVGSMVCVIDLVYKGAFTPIPPLTFTRNHIYDPRLADRKPPYFPEMPNRFEVAIRNQKLVN